MRIKFRSVKGRKGLLSLEALLGLILSVMALVFLFQLFSVLFLQTPTNEKIAEQNAKSISEFIDFSKNTYENLDACYSMLKLNNLENFQIDNDKNYYYILSIDGIYIIDKNQLLVFLDKKDISLIKKKPDIYYNENKISLNGLYRDSTDDGSSVLQGFTFGLLGEADIKIKTDLKIDYILLEPIVDENQNKFLVGLFKGGKDVSCGIATGQNKRNNVGSFKSCLESSYLVLDVQNNNLFALNNEVSQALAMNNLCSKKFFEQSNKIKYFSNNIKNIDYINKEIILGWKLLDTKKFSNDLRFIWKNGPVCKKDISNQGNFDDTTIIDCGILLSNFDKNMNYKDFIDEINNYYRDNQVLSGTVALESFEDIKYEAGKKINNNINFKDVFVKSKYQVSNISSGALKDKVFDGFGYFGRIINGGTSISKNLIYENGKIYFYVDDLGSNGESGFYNFNSYFLRKKELSNGGIEIYFNGEKISYEKKIATKGSIPFFKDEVNFYLFDINGVNNDYKDKSNDFSYNVIISEYQFNSIERIKEND